MGARFGFAATGILPAVFVPTVPDNANDFYNQLPLTLGKIVGCISRKGQKEEQQKKDEFEC